MSPSEPSPTLISPLAPPPPEQRAMSIPPDLGLSSSAQSFQPQIIQSQSHNKVRSRASSHPVPPQTRIYLEQSQQSQPPMRSLNRRTSIATFGTEAVNADGKGMDGMGSVQPGVMNINTMGPMQVNVVSRGNVEGDSTENENRRNQSSNPTEENSSLQPTPNQIQRCSSFSYPRSQPQPSSTYRYTIPVPATSSAQPHPHSSNHSNHSNGGDSSGSVTGSTGDSGVDIRGSGSGSGSGIVTGSRDASHVGLGRKALLLNVERHGDVEGGTDHVSKKRKLER